MKISAVISTWNKKDDVLANLEALKRGSRVPDEIVVVDNASTDGTVEAIESEHPDVVLVTMPHDRCGACETFNIGFKRATGDCIAIMDDDVVATPEWLETLEACLDQEPTWTGMVSSRVVEPGMPAEYEAAEIAQGPYYAATFRGCGTLARTDVLRACGGYDERFFIYGNERDLAARVLNRGWRILQTPDAVIHHATPFGMKAGARSLYYHVRNYWMYAFKYLPFLDILKVTFLLTRRATGGSGDAVRPDATASATEIELEATGTMGFSQLVRQTPGSLWVILKATLAAFIQLPYCLSRRDPVDSPDFRPPGV